MKKGAIIHPSGVIALCEAYALKIISFNELIEKIIAIAQALYEIWVEFRTPKPHKESLADYMSRYLEIRAEVRSTWSPYAQQKCDLSKCRTSLLR